MRDPTSVGAQRQEAAELRREIERLHELLALRGDPRKAAVLRGDLGNLSIVSQPITAAPTADDYNLLREDVVNLARLIDSIAIRK